MWLLAIAAGLCLVGAISHSASGASDLHNAPPLRFGVSDAMVTGVSVSDARAAMSVWSTDLLGSMGLRVAPKEEWVVPSDRLLAAIRAGEIDMFCITVMEYRQVAPYVDTSQIITDDTGGEEYLLVVRAGGGISRLADLRGKSLIQWENPRTNLAEPWLAVSLWNEGLVSPRQLLGRISKNPQLSQVVLPVFFGQADACLVTRTGLNTMAELNPQLLRQLKVLVTSPRIENAFMAFRKGYPAELKMPIFNRMLAFNSSTTARQVLMLFQSRGYIGNSQECLSPATSLLDAYERGPLSVPGRKR
jgi:phosphonate transport system substrate-binding protein